MEFEKRSMTQAEDKYTFAQCSDICARAGFIGYLRADMGTEGNSFYSSWNDYAKELKTEAFKREFDDVINSLREEGDILHNRKELARFCYSTPQARMETEMEYYGVRVDTEKYSYLLRLNPNKGEYNLYCYCYVRRFLDDHMRRAERGISFVDTSYNELFRVPDGGKIVLHSPGEADVVRTCRYINDSHLEMGDNIYHILELAEKMAVGGHSCEPYKKEMR